MKKEFKIVVAAWPNDDQLINETLKLILEGGAKREQEAYSITPQMLKAMCGLATNIWKIKMKMVDLNSGAVLDEMKRAYRHVEASIESLNEFGLTIKDHTGEAFDYGLALRVITTQHMQGATKDTVIETIRPSVFWRGKMVQMGEVVVGTP